MDSFGGMLKCSSVADLHFHFVVLPPWMSHWNWDHDFVPVDDDGDVAVLASDASSNDHVTHLATMGGRSNYDLYKNLQIKSKITWIKSGCEHLTPKQKKQLMCRILHIS